MEIQFNSLEILKMAMEVEKQGKEFYKKCAEVNSEAKVKKLFTKLQQDEKEHYNYFKNLLQQFDQENKSINQNYLYDNVNTAYLKSLVNTKVFPEDKGVTDDIAHNLDEAIEVGINAEKNSLLLYMELVKVEEDKKTVDALEKLIIEEKRHLVELQELKAKL